MRARWWMSWAVMSAACSGVDGSPTKGDTDTDVPDPAVAVVLEADGARVTISAEALRDPSVAFALGLVEDPVALPEGAVPLTGVYALTPADARFDAPVEVVFDAGRGGRGQLLRLADDGSVWRTLDHLDVTTVAAFEVLRFGTFVVVEAPEPADADADGVGDDEDCDADDAEVGAPPLATVWVRPGELIQDALREAGSGDVVGVAGGVYAEVISVLGKDLRLVSRCPGAAVLDGGRVGLPIVTYDGGAAGSLEGFVLRNGEATDGAAVFIGPGSPAILGNRFEDNEASRDGGAIFVDDTTDLVRVEGNTFVDNLAGRRGGGLATGGTHEVQVIDNRFARNVAISAGGSIHLGGTGSRSLERNTVEESVADEGGGLAGTGAVTLIDNTFSDNRADGRGGAVHLSEATLTLEGGRLEDNQAIGFSGGALALEESRFSVHGVTLDGNQAGTDGGAIDVLGGGGAITACTFSGNEAASDGGALWLDVAAGEVEVTTIEGCLLTGNSAAGRGGAAVDVSDPAIGAVAFSGNTWDANTSEGSGGALYLLATSTTLLGEAFVDNVADQGGGAIVGEDWVGATSEGTFSGNLAGGFGGALHLLGTTEARVWNNQFDGNGADLVGESGGAVRIEAGAAALDEAGVAWERVDHPQCGDEPANTYGSSVPNTPDDVAFADGGACALP
jgi:hypothetical protein